MVRRGLQKHIDDAISTVVEDLSSDLVTNWCKHIKIEQETVSPLGQMVALPIGPKRVECPYFHGWSAMTVAQAANSFIEANCHGCPYHEEVHPNNIGREIVERVAERKKRGAGVEAAHEELESLIPAEPSSLLDHDPDSDDSVKELAGLLTDDEHKHHAASSLLQAARQRPEIFGRKSASYMQGAFFDSDVGSTVIETIRHLGIHDREVLREAVDAAKAALERSSNEAAAAALLVDASEAGAIEATAELAGLLVDALPVPVHFLERSGRGRPTEGVKEQTRRLARLHFDVVSEAAKGRLASSNDYLRAKGAAAAQRLAEVDAEAATDSLLDPLVAALAFEDDDGSTDATIHDALATMLLRCGRPVADRLFEAAGKSDADLRGAILATFRADEALESNTEDWLPRLITHISNSARTAQDRESVGHILSAITYRRPELLTPYLEQLLGALAVVAQERESLSKQKPKDEEVIDLESFFNFQGGLSAFDLLLRLLRETIVHTAAARMDRALENVGQLLANTSTEIAAEFKGQLLNVVGEIGRWNRSVAPELTPMIFPHLLDPKSALIRMRAADACRDLVTWNRDVLPEEMLVALGGLLADEFLAPSRAAVRALTRAKVDDPRLAMTIVGRLTVAYGAYREDREQIHFVRDILETLSNLANQHPDLLPGAAGFLADGATIEEFYTAKDCLQEFGWFVLRHPEYQPPYIDALISYYKRFRLAMVSSSASYGGEGQEDSEFEMLYRLETDVGRSKARGLVELGLAQERAFNKVQIGLVLAAHELPDEAAELFDAFAGAVSEPRMAYQRDRFSALALVLRAQARVAASDADLAADLFDQAADALSSLVRPPRNLPFGLDQVLPEDERPDPYLEWIDIMRAWLDLPESDHRQAVDSLQTLSDRLERVREKEAQEEDDDTFLRAIVDVAEGAKHVCLWYESVRSADSKSAAQMDAARARLAEATTRVKGSRWKLLARCLNELVGLVEALEPAGGIRQFLQSVRMLQVPFPKFDMPAGSRRRITSPGERGAAPETVSETETSPPVAFVKATIDGMEAPQVTALLADQIHDLKLEIELSAPAGGSTLHVVPMSVLPASAYDFPKSEIQLSAEQTRYEVGGPLIFKHAQAAGASPTTIRVSLELESDGQRQTIDVFGERTLAFRVVEEETIQRLTGEESVALEALRAALEELIPAAQDGHRQEEESVVSRILEYAAQHLRDPRFRELPVTEKHFQRDLAWYLRMKFGEEVLREVQSGRGFIDVLVLGVPVELKVATDAPKIAEFVESSLPQVTQYTISQVRPVGVLVVLDMTERTASTPRLRDDVRVYPGPTIQGLRDTGSVAIVTLVVRGAVVQPSALRG